MTCFDMGFNLRIGKTNLYALAGVGLAFEDDLINVKTHEEDALLVYKAAFGVDIPLNRFMCLTVESGVFGVNPLGTSPMLKVGAAFTLPDLIL